MLFAQSVSRAIAVLAICTTVIGGLPAGAHGDDASFKNVWRADKEQVNTLENDKPALIAQASCASCGAELNPLVLAASADKEMARSPLTDSLWGNLILELAYQRDKELAKISKRMVIANYGTMGAIGTIAGGTLAQGIIAIGVLNPQPGHLDSYTPLIIGTALSAVTMMVFAARATSNKVLAKQITNRQTAIKQHVEAILAHMEHSNGKCDAARAELTEMIGERASKEWVQLFQSSHQLAMTDPRHFSMLPAPDHID